MGISLRARVRTKIDIVRRRFALRLRNVLTDRFLLPAVFLPKLRGSKPAGRARPLYLLLRHQSCHGDPKFGPSNEEHFISSPLRSANIADVVEFYYDPAGERGAFRDSQLVSMAARLRPDVIFLSSYDCFDISHPCFDVLKAIRATCAIPLVAIWHDTTGEIALRQYAHMRGHVDLHILLDSGRLQDHFADEVNFLQLWAPLDFSIFAPGNDRDIPVSFLGSTGGYRDIRESYLRYLAEQGIDVHRSGGQAEQLMNLADYARVLGRSKISLNFSHSLPGTHQLKARVFEILFSGALLMESENEWTARVLTPMLDYVPFSSPEDLRDKIRYYLAHDDERNRIARNGYLKATREFNHEKFWGKVRGRLRDLGIS